MNRMSLATSRQLFVWLIFVLLIIILMLTVIEFKEGGAKNEFRKSRILGFERLEKRDSVNDGQKKRDSVNDGSNSILTYQSPSSDIVVLPSKEKIHNMTHREVANLYHSYINSLQVLCRRVVRVGYLEDGGWEICEDSNYHPHRPCLVYSFGINYDYSFDDDIVRRYGCEVHSFDPSMRNETDHRRGALGYFHKNGLGDLNEVNPVGWQLKRLQTIRRELGHTNFDISMELGLDFDDEDFQNEKKQAPTPVSYNAKFCFPLWFLSATTEDTDSVAQILKFKGDNFFYLGNYIEAVEAYRTCLDALPENNKTMQREVNESLARCHLHSGEAEKALKIAEELQKNCMTVDQNLQILTFLQQIYSAMDRVDDEIDVLHQLISLHRFNVQFWVRLACAYEKLISGKHAEDSDDVQILHGVGLHIDLKILTCFIRVRLLLRSCHQSVGSFIRFTNNQLLQQTEEKIQRYCPDERLLSVATEYLKRDLSEQEGSTSLNESEEDDLSDLTLSTKTSDDDVSQSFENQWFAWIERAKKS